MADERSALHHILLRRKLTAIQTRGEEFGILSWLGLGDVIASNAHSADWLALPPSKLRTLA